WIAALEPRPEYMRLWESTPEGLIPDAVRGFMGDGGAAGGPQLSLPWASGETWQLTSGPHGDALEALDFTGGSGLVRAADEGIAYTPCPNMVVIYHQDGWQTGYYHMADIAISDGQAVTRGQVLGRTWVGTGCGGWASGPHVHFWTQYNGVPQPIDGRTIGGWLVQQGASAYEGCMVRGNDRACAGQGQIANDGTVGDGAPPTMPPTPVAGSAPATTQRPKPGQQEVLVSASDAAITERGGIPDYFFPFV